MRNLTVKDIVLEPGRPKIAVPITGRNHGEIMKQVAEAIKGPCDILDWRADYFFGEMDSIEEKVENSAAHMEMIRILDDIDYMTSSMPLIFTIKVAGQGGKVRLERAYAYDLASLAAQSKLVDFTAMDILDDDNEIDQQQILEYVEEVHNFGVKVIHSYHNYTAAPSYEDMVRMGESMRSLGADVVKIVVKPENHEEALEVLKASAYLTQDEKDPVILVGLGKEGFVTRVAGGKYGSCISYAYAAEATAQGQVDVNTLSRLLDDYYGE